MSFRNLVLTLHLWAGLLASAFLLLLGLTGSLLAYETSIDHALNRRLVHVQPATRPLPLEKLFAGLEKAHPGYRVTDLAFSGEPDIAYQMYLNPGGEAGLAASWLRSINITARNWDMRVPRTSL